MQITGVGIGGAPGWESFYSDTGTVRLSFSDVVDGIGDPIQLSGSLSGNTITYQLNGVTETVLLVNESQLRRQATGATYQLPFIPNFTSGLWCVVGSTGQTFVFQIDPNRDFLPSGPGSDPAAQYSVSAFGAPGNVVARVADFRIADPPSANALTASVRSFVVDSGPYAGDWRGFFEGASTIRLELVSNPQTKLSLQRRRTGDSCS